MGLFASLKSLFGFGSSTPTLKPGDKMLVCEDCNTNFVFDAGEQAFFKSKGFTEPKRCPKCRKTVRSRMRRRRRGHGQGHQQNQNNTHQNNQNQHSNNRRDNNQRHGRHHGRRHSVIDGDSPYADER